MNFLCADIRNPRTVSLIASQVRTLTGGIGSGAGRGGGGGGSIRSAGGAFGEQAAAKEEQYFHSKVASQLKKLKEDLMNEIQFHESQIQKYQEAILRHQRRLTSIEKPKLFQ